MIKIVHSPTRAEVEPLLPPTVIRDRATERAAARIVEKVRTGGDEALAAFAKKFDALTGPIEISRQEIEAGAAQAAPAVRAAIKRAAAAIRKVAKRQVPKG